MQNVHPWMEVEQRPDERLEKIRNDLDLFLPPGSYRLEKGPRGGLRLLWDRDLPGDLRHFSAEVLRLYELPFEAETRLEPRRVERRRSGTR